MSKTPLAVRNTPHIRPKSPQDLSQESGKRLSFNVKTPRLFPHRVGCNEDCIPGMSGSCGMYMNRLWLAHSNSAVGYTESRSDSKSLVVSWTRFCKIPMILFKSSTQTILALSSASHSHPSRAHRTTLTSEGPGRRKYPVADHVKVPHSAKVVHSVNKLPCRGAPPDITVSIQCCNVPMLLLSAVLREH